jgi:hypothetical protein
MKGDSIFSIKIRKMARPSAARKMIRRRSPRRLETTALTACLRSHCKSSEEGKTRLAVEKITKWTKDHWAAVRFERGSQSP